MFASIRVPTILQATYRLDLRAKNEHRNIPADASSAEFTTPSGRRAKISSFIESFENTTTDLVNQNDRQHDTLKIQEEGIQSRSTSYSKGEDLAEFEHLKKLDANDKSRYVGWLVKYLVRRAANFIKGLKRMCTNITIVQIKQN